jgi:hypothetical protein
MLRNLFPYALGLVILAIASAWATVRWFPRAWLEQRLKQSSEQTLARFKHELESASAAASFDYSRRLQDFNLFIVKKHEAIAQLHGLLLEAMSQIVRFAQDERPPRAQLTNFGREDAGKYMAEDANVPRGMVADILALWDTERDKAIERLSAYQDDMQGEHAGRALEKAHNYRLRNDLYLPDEISEGAAQFLSRLRRLLQAARSERGHAAPDVYQEAGVIHTELAGLKVRMKEEMRRSELSPAH